MKWYQDFSLCEMKREYSEWVWGHWTFIDMKHLKGDIRSVNEHVSFSTIIVSVKSKWKELFSSRRAHFYWISLTEGITNGHWRCWRGCYNHKSRCLAWGWWTPGLPLQAAESCCWLLSPSMFQPDGWPQQPSALHSSSVADLLWLEPWKDLWMIDRENHIIEYSSCCASHFVLSNPNIYKHINMIRLPVAGLYAPVFVKTFL